MSNVITLTPPIEPCGDGSRLGWVLACAKTAKPEKARSFIIRGGEMSPPVLTRDEVDQALKILGLEPQEKPSHMKVVK